MSMFTCNFCGKSNEEVEKMIVGPDGVSICNECVAICAIILLDKRAEESMDKEERQMGIAWR